MASVHEKSPFDGDDLKVSVVNYRLASIYIIIIYMLYSKLNSLSSWPDSSDNVHHIICYLRFEDHLFSSDRVINLKFLRVQ